MKGFIFSVCIIAFIFILVALNSVYVKRITGSLIDKIETLNYNSYDVMKEIRELWDKNSFVIGISSSTKETDKIEDMLASLESMYRKSSFLGLEEKKSLLINYIKLIQSHEKLSIENIL